MVQSQLLALLFNEDSLFQPMSATNITASSTKAQILESAEELIGDLDEKLEAQERLNLTLKEERNLVAYLLLGTSAYIFLF